MGGFRAGDWGLGVGSWRGKTPPFLALIAQIPLLWYICDFEYFPMPLISSGFLLTFRVFCAGAIAVTSDQQNVNPNFGSCRIRDQISIFSIELTIWRAFTWPKHPCFRPANCWHIFYFIFQKIWYEIYFLCISKV